MANTHSIEFNGSDQYAENTNTALNNGGNTWTIEGWFYADSVTGQHVMMQDRLNNDSVGEVRRVQVNDSVLAGQTWATVGGFLTVAAATTISTSTWYHTAFVKRSDSSWEIYLNGVSDGTSSSTRDSSLSQNAGFIVGAAKETTYFAFWDGKIDDVRIWNTARTTGEISGNKDDELTGSESGLDAYWKFNNGYTDSGPGGYTLTAGGTPTFSTTVPFVGSVAISVNDAITVSESVTMEITSFISVNDAITLSESVTVDPIFDISVSDSITVSESLTVEIPFLGDVLVYEAITITESITMSMDLADISVFDAITVSEWVDKDFPWDIFIYDEISVSESVSVSMDLGNVSVNDAITITESVTTVVAAARAGLITLHGKDQEYPLAMDDGRAL